jgi:ATP-dependent Clp protease ATP-binding subunit ClpC
MIDFEYQVSNSGWPVHAVRGVTTYEFSGTFSATRIREERTLWLLGMLIKTALWLLVLMGIVALGFSAWQGYGEKNICFLFAHDNFNIVLWTGVLAGMFLWAKGKQGALDKQRLNLLKLYDHQPKIGAAKTLDIYNLFSPEAKAAWNKALTIAGDKKIAAVTAADLLQALLTDQSVRLAFLRLGTNPKDISNFLSNRQRPGGIKDELDKLPFVALDTALRLHNRTIDPLMLLCSLSKGLPEKHDLQEIFFSLNVDTEKLEALASWIFHMEILRDEFKLFKKLSRYKPDSEINTGLTSVPTFYLDKVSADLTRAAKYGRLPLALGRAEDLHEIFRLLASGKQNILIKGPLGSGRTTVINELAYKMAAEQVPELLEDKRLVKLEVAAILGSRFKTEEALMNALDEAERAGNITVVIEDIHQLARAQGTEGLTLLEVLVNFLQSSSLMVIATTTIEDYTDYLRALPNFEEIFLGYELSNLSRNNILLAACVRATLLENQNNCFFTFGAIEKAVELTDQYVKDVSQPQKAIAILVEAATRGKSKERGQRLVNEEVIQTIVSAKTHIPASTLSKNESTKLMDLEMNISKYVIGQKAAVRAVAEGLRRSRSGLASATRPLASFLFLGPTGVGKTEIARTLAKIYFGDERYMLRVDMSEFRGESAMDKFLGSEGRKTDPPIIKHIKNYPFCLLLLDEFEKAGPEIINLFLQVLEDGRLTSGKGELIDLTQTLVIATSNAGTKEIQEGQRANKTLDQIKTQIFNQVLNNYFPPELLNRFDGVVLFSPLSTEEIEQITALQLNSLAETMLTKGIKVSFAPAVLQDISANAYDPLLGARPIRRYIQDHIESFIAKLLLSKKLPRGTEITIDFQNGGYIVN